MKRARARSCANKRPGDRRPTAMIKAFIDRHKSKRSPTMVAAEAALNASELAEAASAALHSTLAAAPPPPLPPGWVRKEARSQPGYSYYYHQETGQSVWELPRESVDQDDDEEEDVNEPLPAPDDETLAEEDTPANEEQESHHNNKRPLEPSADHDDDPARPSKKAKPSKVRILHILKKHKGSRRPASWRNPKITISLQDARAELQELLDVLREEEGASLRATFEELARTESDCSSAKRGGDLGFFGPKKMQPAFEEASFALEIGEMSGLVETNSGVHILLRVG